MQIMFSSNGTIFKKQEKDHIYKSFTFGCSKGWNKGIHKISIMNKAGGFGNDAFGITTNIEFFKDKLVWYNKAKWQDGYFYVLNKNNLLSMNDDINNHQIQRRIFKTNESKPGDILCICLNTDEWMVTFSLNDKQLGKSMKIIKNETYHLFISSSRHSVDQVEYHLFLD